MWSVAREYQNVGEVEEGSTQWLTVLNNKTGVFVIFMGVG